MKSILMNLCEVRHPDIAVMIQSVGQPFALGTTSLPNFPNSPPSPVFNKRQQGQDVWMWALMNSSQHNNKQKCFEEQVCDTQTCALRSI